MLALATAAAQKLSKDELAIKQLIEKETEFFSNGNYDAWSSMWEHSETIFWAYYSPTDMKEFTTWDELNVFLKERIEKYANNPVKFAPKADYKFFLNKNSAHVTFLQGKNRSSRVLVKRNGEWKIIQMTISKADEYKREESLNILKSYCGKWKLDMSTFKHSDNWKNTLEAYDADIREKDGTIIMSFKGLIKMPNNKVLQFRTESRISIDSESGEITTLIESIGTNHHKYYGGKGILDDRRMEINYFPILDPEIIDSKGIMKFKENGSIECRDEYFDKDGNVSLTFDYTLVRQL